MRISALQQKWGRTWRTFVCAGLVLAYFGFVGEAIHCQYFADSSHTLARIEKGKDSERGAVRLLNLTGTAQPEQPVLVNLPESAPDATHSAPGLALGPEREIYLTWSIPKPAHGGVSATDLLLARSLDDGKSFDAPIVVNDDGGLASHGFEGVSVWRDGLGPREWDSPEMLALIRSLMK